MCDDDSSNIIMRVPLGKTRSACHAPFRGKTTAASRVAVHNWLVESTGTVRGTVGHPWPQQPHHRWGRKRLECGGHPTRQVVPTENGSKGYRNILQPRKQRQPKNLWTIVWPCVIWNLHDFHRLRPYIFLLQVFPGFNVTIVDCKCFLLTVQSYLAREYLLVSSSHQTGKAKRAWHELTQ